jgi:hypothetical protein
MWFGLLTTTTATTATLVLVRELTIPTARPPLVGEVSANFLRIQGGAAVSAAEPYGRNLGWTTDSVVK